MVNTIVDFKKDLAQIFRLPLCLKRNYFHYLLSLMVINEASVGKNRKTVNSEADACYV